MAQYIAEHWKPLKTWTLSYNEYGFSETIKSGHAAMFYLGHMCH